MEDIFWGPVDLMQSAKGHIDEIISILVGIFNEDWATVVKETDHQTGETIFRVKFHTPVPIRVATRVFNVVTELRSALDHAVYAATVALGERSDPTKTKFPFGDTASEFEQNLIFRGDHVTSEIFNAPDCTKALQDWKSRTLELEQDQERERSSKTYCSGTHRACNQRCLEGRKRAQRWASGRLQEGRSRQRLRDR
jgi:hypothetical protein